MLKRKSRDGGSSRADSRREKFRKLTLDLRAFKSRKAAQSLSKYVNRQGLSPEIKYIDVTDTSDVSGNGGYTLLNGCVAGTGNNQRLGRKIQMTSVSIKCMFASEVADLTGMDYDCTEWKVALVYDKQANATGITSYANVYAQQGNIYTALAMRNLDNIDRFDVLKEWQGVLCSAGPNGMLIDEYVPIRLDTRYDSSVVGDITDIVSGALYLVYGSGATTAGTYPGIKFVSRVRFIDN